jgi:hypothetical protein
MSIQSSTAIESAFKGLLKFLDERKEKPPEQQLKELRKEIEDTIVSAHDGWE